MREQFAEFYELDSFADEMRFLISYAVHKTDPWQFRIVERGVEVRAAASESRELLLSIGAAITNFRVAAAHFGYDTSVLYTGGTKESATVAFISFVETCAPPQKLAGLFKAIGNRHASRGDFDGQAIEPAALATICDVLDEWPDTLRVLQPHQTGDRRFFQSASMFVLVTSDDDRVSLVRAGEALEILLLTITRLDLRYSFATEATERLQLLVRIGRSTRDATHRMM